LEQPQTGCQLGVKKPKTLRDSVKIERIVNFYSLENVLLPLLLHQKEVREAARGFPVADRVTQLFSRKGLLQTEIYREASLLAKTIDDLVLRDGHNIFQSRGALRIISRLCGIDVALGPVTSEATLSRANWRAADEFELPIDDNTADLEAVGRLAIAEARRSLSSKRRLERVGKTCKTKHPCWRAWEIEENTAELEAAGGLAIAEARRRLSSKGRRERVGKTCKTCGAWKSGRSCKTCKTCGSLFK
jgi:hypothetical protein